MSTTIDERVVEMRFDNQHFEKNVKNSLNTIEKLKTGLNFNESAKSLNSLNKATKSFSMNGIASGVETVRAKFSALEVMGITALANITNSAVNAGKKIASALTIEPVTSGFQEYETQINAVQTILANTQSKGNTLEDVNKALDELNSYADKTIYNFTEMTRNIGTFTAAGVELDTSVQAIKGIANLAAVSGSTSQQASTAMYQLSQALASGTVKLMDWNSVVNAGMGGQVFQDALKETARVHGIAIDSMIKSEGSFRETLKDGWLTSDILTETLAKFTGDLNEEQLRTMGYTEEQIAEIIKLGKTANDAATKVKTFSQLFDTLKEAVQSGWTQTWEIIVGNFEEAKSFLTELSDIFGYLIGKSAESRNNVLEGWADLGGRTKLLEAVKNAFNAVASVVAPIKEAFDEIFPPTTSQQLYNLTEGLTNFLKSIQLTETQSENLKRTFKGLFAILDIVGQAFGAVWNAVRPMIGGLGSLGDGVLGVTASWGDWLANLSQSIRETNVFNTALQKVVGFIQNGFVKAKNVFDSAVTSVKQFGTAISEKFNLPGFEVVHAFLERIHERFSSLISSLGDVKKSFDSTLNGIGGSAESSGIVKVLIGVWTMVKTIGNGIAKAVGALTEGLVNSISDANFDGILDIINSISLGGIAIGIGKFLTSLSKPVEGLNSILGNVTGILDGVRGCFEAYQTQLKAGTLMTIASAIGILTASIFAISLIDSEKLTTSFGAITGLFAELMGSLAIFGKIGGSLSSVTKTAGVMVTMSVSIGILALSMKSLSSLDWDGVIKGLTGVAGLSAIMVTSAKILSKNTKELVKGTSGLVVFAVAIKVLASACKDLSTLSWEGLTKGLVGVGALLGEVSLFLNFAKFSGKTMTTATGILILSGALKVLASVCDDFGSLSWESIGKGLTSIGVLLAEVTAFTNLTGNAKHVISTGAALILISAAMKIFASSISDFGSMNWTEIGKGLIAMGVALAEVTLAVNLMPKNMISVGLGLAVVSGSLLILANALTRMGGMTWEGIAKGLVSMGGALAIIAIGLHAMNSTLLGSAALLVAAGALAIIAPTLSLMGSMSWESIGKGLVTLAGAFAVIGIAGLLLTPIIPSILALSGAFAAIGIGAVAVGGGLLLASIGLQGLALAIGTLSTVTTVGATAIVASLTIIVTGIAALIPTVIGKIGEGIVAFGQAIIAGAPVITGALIVVVSSFVTALVSCTPQIVDGALSILTSLLESIVAYTPRIVDAVLNIIIAVLDGVASNIPRIIQAGVDIISALLIGLGQAIPQLVDAGFQMIIDFINGVAESIRTNTPLLVDAMGNLINAMIESALTVLTGGNTEFVDAGMNVVNGFIEGIKNTISNAVEAAKELGSEVMDSLKDFFDINSPAKETEKQIGEPVGQGVAVGEENAIPEVKKASEKLGNAAMDTLSKVTTEGSKDLINTQKKYESESVDTKKDYWSELIGVTEDGTSEVTEIQEESVATTDKVRKKTTEGNKKAIEETESYWAKLLEIHKNGADKKKYKDMKLVDFEKEILDQTVNIWGEYTNALASKNDSIVNQIGLFEEVTHPKAEDMPTADKLKKNLNDQIKEYESFAHIIASLNNKISDGNFKDAINDMSISSINELRVLNNMTDAELTHYAELYEYKYALARQAATTQLDSLATETEQKLSNLYGGVDVNLTDFASTFDGGMESISKYVQLSMDQAALAKESGSQIVDGYAEGITQNQAGNEAAVAMIDNAEMAAREAAEIHSPSELFRREVGSYLTEGVAVGMTDKEFMVQNAATQLIVGALTVLRNARGSFVIVGQNASMGFKEGILSKASEIAAAAAQVASDALAAAQAAIDSHSPSRKFMELGQFADEGFAIGLRNYSKMVSDESYNVGSNAVNSISSAIANVSSLIENGIDSEPTIRPVLDLSNVSAGTHKLSSMLSRNSAMSISTGMKRNNSSTDTSTSSVPVAGGNTYNMIQNNYSPKSLSRIDIYRQTKNLFGTMKGTVSGT